MDVRVIRDGDIPRFGVVSVEHEEIEATYLVCDWLEAAFQDDGCWIKASSALYCSGEKRTISWDL